MTDRGAPHFAEASWGRQDDDFGPGSAPLVERGVSSLAARSLFSYPLFPIVLFFYSTE